MEKQDFAQSSVTSANVRQANFNSRHGFPPPIRRGSIYSIFDKKARDFGPMFEAINDSIAARNYRVGMKDNPFPDDFQLLVLADFLFENGNMQILPYSIPQLVNVDEVLAFTQDQGDGL